MILLLLGCVDQLYPGRTWRCDDWLDVQVLAPGPLRLRDAGPDTSCRVSAYGERFPRPTDGAFFDAEDVEIVGSTDLFGSWEAGPDLTEIVLTDRASPDDEAPLLDLVRIEAPPTGSGRFTWTRTAGERAVIVECDRCTVRARQVDLVTIRQSHAASIAWVCEVGQLIVGSPLAGLVTHHDLGEPPVLEGDVDRANLWAASERPDACWR